MKRLIRTVIIVLAAFVLACLTGVLPMPVRAVGGVASNQSGDVNGDGAIDISDPVYMLQFLFQGGPAPKACAEASTVDARLDALEASVTALNHRLDCALVAPQVQPDRFTDNGDGTVTDSCTGLQWQKETGDVNDDGAIDGRDAVLIDTAKLYVKGIGLGGHHDWRLPTIRELESLIDRARVNPAIDPVFDDTTRVLSISEPNVADYYVTSDPACVGCGNNALLAVDFGGAGKTTLWNCCAFRLFVRAVRRP